MKLLLTIALITFFQMTSFSQVDKRPTDPKELGEMVFKSFQDENYEMFLKYIFTESDCDTMAKNADAPDSLKITAVEQMKRITNYIRQTSKENFEMIISTGKQNGLDWRKTKLTDVLFEIKSNDNIQHSDIFLFCEYKDKIFLIKLDDCHKSDSWLMLGNTEIQFK